MIFHNLNFNFLRFFLCLKTYIIFFSTYLHDENFYLIFEFLLIITRKISAAGGWAPLRCSLQSVPPPAADNQGVWGSEGGGGGGWPRPGPLLSSSSSCHFHVSLLCSSSLTEYTFLFSPFSLHMPLSCFRASIRVLFSRCFRLPTTCEGDGAQQLGFTNRDLVGTLHSVCISIILIVCLFSRSFMKLEKVILVCAIWQRPHYFTNIILYQLLIFNNL